MRIECFSSEFHVSKSVIQAGFTAIVSLRSSRDLSTWTYFQSLDAMGCHVAFPLFVSRFLSPIGFESNRYKSFTNSFVAMVAALTLQHKLFKFNGSQISRTFILGRRDRVSLPNVWNIFRRISLNELQCRTKV